MKFITVIIIAICNLYSICNAQTNVNCETVLDKEPYFVKHEVTEKDRLYLNDLKILKQCGNFIGIDTLLFKGSLFLAVMDELKNAEAKTYREVILTLNNFKNTNIYKEFIDGLLLYKSLENKIVNLKTWETDKELFVRLGFSEADLDDFRVFIKQKRNRKINYKEAYLLYMKEIEALGNTN